MQAPGVAEVTRCHVAAANLSCSALTQAQRGHQGTTVGVARRGLYVWSERAFPRQVLTHAVTMQCIWEKGTHTPPTQIKRGTMALPKNAARAGNWRAEVAAARAAYRNTTQGPYVNAAPVSGAPNQERM